MGCDGCELWKPTSAILALVPASLLRVSDRPKSVVAGALARIVGERKTSELYRDRKQVASDVAQLLDLDKKGRECVVDVIRRECKCYAGLLGTMRHNHPGYADRFEDPKLFPGRMGVAAGWGAPNVDEVNAKPWLPNHLRLIFVSDMGDALSKNVSFEYLKQEIIQNVVSDSGRRHLWLWLTKRPARMAQFGKWLSTQNIPWPDNLVAMTTVTSRKTINRIAQLQQVTSRFKALSVEPLFGPVELPLDGIDWVIVGGGSDVLAEPFHSEWALDIRSQCQKAGAAFFLKQLGKAPCYHGQPLELEDRHGGDWNEWPPELRIREVPAAFHDYQPVAGGRHCLELNG